MSLSSLLFDVSLGVSLFGSSLAGEFLHSSLLAAVLQGASAGGASGVLLEASGKSLEVSAVGEAAVANEWSVLTFAVMTRMILM